ncbi:tetratricopeptide repeat protein [Piscinibacter sp.]|uniref:tetratricopeptide repeat protein n=1 Tax=Piscinibacter sp. TaxID=1903157 RepID=UPI00355AAFA7
MSSPIRIALRRVAGAAALVSVFAAGTATAADTTGHPIKDPHYGDTLFHFYQEHYFTSVTTLMASQHFKRVSQHADEAEVLRGGMLLSYGLHREAGEIFAQLIEKGAAPAVRDRAWFYLAKIRYQRGFIPEAEDAVARIENHLPPELEEERGLLKANLLMAHSDFAGAAAVLNSMTSSKAAGQYARFNLGVALIRSGEAPRGSALLDELGRAPATNEEDRSLRDKANVALGFAALQDNRFEAARTYLERVRLTSMQANKALLGFGWAAEAMKQPKLALVPWMELAERDASDSAVLEARIAVPFAFAELGAYSQSLERYNEAIAAFDRENTGLDESIAAIRAGKLVDGLLERNPGDEMGWFWSIRELPEMPHAGHLAQVLAQHEFQEAFKNYRDLRFLAKNLQQWQDNLGVFGDMLANRRKAYAERLPQIRAKASDSGLRALSLGGALLAAELTRAETETDTAAFADAKERDLRARLDSVQAMLKQAGNAAEFAAARERARLAEGALTWQLAQEYPARLWEAKKALSATDQGLSDARRRDAALAQAQRDEPARFERFAQRIDELDPRVKALIPRVAALSIEQQQAVQEIAVAELTRQKERLAIYATQARFAVAQLYDRANLPREADHAGKQ